MSELKEAASGFDLSQLDAEDTAEMVVLSNGKPTNWVWTFAGPGHPRTIEVAKRHARENLQIEREKEQARVNGRKWKAPVESEDEVLARNVGMVVDRLIGWSDVLNNGEPFPFSPENARKILMDPKKNGLLMQAAEFLGDEKSFTTRSVIS